jgi:molybdopterin-guanine dinucleotide biosynthesis protein A
MTASPAFSAVILAGGRSSRMGRDKAWVEWAGRPLIVQAIEKARRWGAAEIFVSGRPDGDYTALGCPVLLDLEPGRGPLAGIERGLAVAASPLVLVLAVDLPMLTLGFLEALASRCDCRTGVVPEVQGALEPLAAVYPKRCHVWAQDALARPRAAARDFAAMCLKAGAVRAFPITGAAAECLANWNRPEDRPAAAPAA